MLDAKTIGCVLRELRKSRGLRSPTIETLFKIAQALEIQPHEIVKRIEDKIKKYQALKSSNPKHTK